MAVAALAPGCLGADEEARPATGAPREIAEVVQRLERATLRGDWTALCEDLFTEAARARAGGPDCARLTGEAGRAIRRPAIEIRAIRVRGARAFADVRTRAAGQAEVADVVELRREGGEWRVEALGG
jgi:hypothetical protein